MQRIASRQHKVVARYRAVARGEDRELLLLDGMHLVGEALEARLRLLQAAVASDALGRPDVRAIVERLRRAGVEVLGASPPVMAVLSPVRSASVLVAIAVRPKQAEERVHEGPRPLVVVVHDVQDPGNVGAIVRAAEAAGATGVVTTGGTADPFGWKALRGSMGSALRLPIARRDLADQAVAEARRRGCRIVAAVPRGGRSLFDVDFLGPIAVLVGGEGRGLPATLVDAADLRVTIPMTPPVESLNAALAVAVMAYEARRQRTSRGLAVS